MIQEGRVTVNDELVVELGRKVSDADEVRVDGELVRSAKLYTLLLNKPAGVVTTMRDPQGRPTIVRYLPDYGVALKPVGRLDMDTEGLLIVTNDGDLAHRLAHPSYGVEKEYQAKVEGLVEDRALNALRTGLFLEGRKTHPAKVHVAFKDPKGFSVLNITIHEGRKRQVRMMCEAVGHPVIALKRVRLGPFALKGMRPGEARLLHKQEVDALRALVGL
jgi:pseudouridine synthase